jgi:hypothetical protein
MSGEGSSNQAEGRFISHSQETSQEESSISQSTITQITNEQHETPNMERVAAQEGEVLYKGAPILTVETFNQIAKASGQNTPLHKHKSRSDFFKSKEESYLKEMGKYQNDDSSYTVSHPIAMTIALAL